MLKSTYDSTKFNELFARLGVLMKKTRAGFWAEHEYGIRHSRPFHHGKPEAGLWFRTRGCGYDRVGGCVMCDYGSGPNSTTSEEMIGYVEKGLQELPQQLYHLLVSPLGSFLDEWEVPREARLGILRLMSETAHEAFSFESRAETIDDQKIAEACSLLGHRLLKVYMGLESADPWISKYCINKSLSLASFEQAIQTLTGNGVATTANVILGAPFLSANQQIEEALQSLHWAFAKGASECCFFPTHVKKWTTLIWLYNKQLYKMPSLWSYVEVLHRLGPATCNKIELSWYSTKKYQDPNLVASPMTCERCYATVIEYLDKFDESADFQYIDKLVALECDCKDSWREELVQTPSSSVLERAIAAYDQLGQEVFKQWWHTNRERVLTNMQAEAPTSLTIPG